MISSSALCQIEDLPDGAARGVRIQRDGKTCDLVLIRKGEGVLAYLNRCPHRRTPLNWTKDQFLDREGGHLICATHGALFRIEDGFCLAGPCAGDSLRAVLVRVRNGAVYPSS